MALLQNHIAVVTGAGSGIGRAIATGYAREGARVVLLDVNEKAAAEVAGEIRGSGGKAESFALDVTKRDDCVALAKQIAAKVGQVSILVNNAGIARRNGMLGARRGRDQATGKTSSRSTSPASSTSPMRFSNRCAPPRGASSISDRSSRSCI